VLRSRLSVPSTGERAASQVALLRHTLNAEDTEKLSECDPDCEKPVSENVGTFSRELASQVAATPTVVNDYR